MLFIEHVAASVLRNPVHLVPGPWPQPSFLGQQFEDVVVECHFAEDNFFPAEGAVGFDPEAIDAGLADGVVHCADDEGDVGAAVVGAEADVALVDGPLEFLSDASPHNYLYLSVDDMKDHHLICNRKIIS